MAGETMMVAQHVLGTILAVLQVASATAAGVQKDVQPALFVQIVDKGWLPIPGMSVEVSVASGDRRGKGAGGWSSVATTDVKGFAGFSPRPPHGDFRIVVPRQGGFKEHGLSVRLYAGAGGWAAYVQLRLTDLEEYVPLQ